MVSPELWRTHFKARYKEQFSLAHDLSLFVWFHSCGYVLDILPDLIEIGADVINLNQPDLFGIERLGEQFAGQICFNCPVDHQTTAVTGTDEEIDCYVLCLKNSLSKNGGFMGYIEEYSSIGMSDHAYTTIENCFYTHRNYK